MYSSKNDQETYTKQIRKTNKQAKTKAGSMERHFQKTLTDNKNTATPNSSFHPLDAWKGEFKKSFFPCVLLGDFEKKNGAWCLSYQKRATVATFTRKNEP